MWGHWLTFQRKKSKAVSPFSLTQFVLTLELLYTTSCINDLLRTCKEWVTLITNIDRHFIFIRLDRKLISTCASYCTINIIWMDIFSHLKTFL